MRLAASLLGLALAFLSPAGVSGVPTAQRPSPPATGKPALHRFWPQLPRPARLLTLRAIPSPEAAILAQTLAGLAARAVREGRGREMIWYPIAHPAYTRWLAAMQVQTGAKSEPPADLWELIARLRGQGIVKGYILYRYDQSQRAMHAAGEADTSVNYATSLCGKLGAVAVSESLESSARMQGLPCLLDARGRREEEAFDVVGTPQLPALAMIDPKVSEVRDEAIALGALTLSAPGPAYEAALARLKPDSPILGWGRGDEFLQTEPATRWGAFQTATDWCENLPALSTESPGGSYPANRLRMRPPRSFWELPWEDGVHYAAFLMSDGDNVQWLMGNFLEDSEHAWWSSSLRGRFPMGWTFCYADLAQLCPYALNYLARTATPNDDLVLMGGGYYYPDLFGKDRPGLAMLRQHAENLAPYMRLGGLRSLLVNVAQWDSPGARAAYATFARALPDLYGLFVIQYSPYTGGEGAVRWVATGTGEELPVLSARFGIWADAHRPREGTPQEVAALLNGMPHAGASDTESHFSWVTVHAWSYFPQSATTPASASDDVSGKARGLAPVRTCVDNLAPYVRVVTPTDLARLMRLRLRPRQTLNRALTELESRVAAQPAASGRKREEATRIVRQARRQWRAGDYRACFLLGQKAHRALFPQG